MPCSSIETKEIQCQHAKLTKGVCTSCGECIEEVELVNSYSEYERPSAVPHMKYTVKNPAKQNLAAIKRILTPCSLDNYLYPVRDLLLTTEFKGRLKIEDKVILVLLHILKANSFPIAIHDLLKFTNIPKHRLLKVYRDTFKFSENSDEYLLGLYERTRVSLEQNGIGCKGNFEAFVKCFQLSKCSDPKLLEFAYFYESSNIPSKDIIYYADYSKSQIRYTRMRIRLLTENQKK